MREMLCRILQKHGYQTRDSVNISDALNLLQQESFSLILSDLQLPDMDGISFFRKVKTFRIPFIILTAFGSIEKAVEAIKEGAFDFIAKPVDPDYLLVMIDKALESSRMWRENVVLKELISLQRSEAVIIGQSTAILDAAEKVRQAAPTDISVLILGESGTGKELFARAIHNLSPRRSRPFIAVNSASLPENLLENELFGHEKGSFTGAYNRQIGKLEMAEGGTFFFDEIGDFPLSLQGKILRFLEEKSITRLGMNREIDLDIRFVFATNQNLDQSVAANRFRRDLYYRITPFPIHLVPLRDRKEDIPLLADYFIQKFGTDMKKETAGLTEEARRKLSDYAWPGNVRELQNTIERATILCKTGSITEADIILPETPFAVEDCMSLSGTLPEVVHRLVARVEKKKIEDTLKDAGFVRNETARRLGISYKTLLEKIKEYGISSDI